LVDRWALCFLLVLSLLTAWLIGYFNASPALLVLLGLAALAVGRGRWLQAVEGAGLEAELKVQRKQDSQLRGESAEWMNFLLNRW
jgi:Ca2+-dependent lipid-binding protein